MGRLSLRNPLATPEQIAESPSQRQGMSAKYEASMRSYGCHLIQASGTILCLPQLVMATAQVLLQRFYYLASIQDFPLRGIVLGTLFLACKTEENPQTIRNIINVVDIVVKRDRGYPEVVTDGYDSEYYELKNEMVIGEMQVLRRLAFNVQVELPYGLLANYLRSLELTDQERVPQLAWNYVNDLLSTPVYVCFQPETIACGAIFLAARECRVGLPTSPPWWAVFDANAEDVVQVAKAIRALKARKVPHIMPLSARELKMHGEGVLDEHVAQMRKEMRDKLDAEMKFASQEKNVDEGDGGGKRSQAEHVDDGAQPKSRRGARDSTSRDHNRRRHTSSRSRDTRHSSYRPH
ncbi:hypothetical protein LPJ62_000900 [Coemansia sp. RSA 2167]|nr:hypothetical protein LPJ62_000900 [Coemansia sp. RSA 2167]KAJ2154070.1 hypothetical protein J3F82_001497 [Coemansia sp. RSA 637]KAJ2536534.1 hypothetical protein IWW43_000773 [Coemansia sp. RSA 1935]